MTVEEVNKLISPNKLIEITDYKLAYYTYKLPINPSDVERFILRFNIVFGLQWIACSTQKINNRFDFDFLVSKYLSSLSQKYTVVNTKTEDRSFITEYIDKANSQCLIKFRLNTPIYLSIVNISLTVLDNVISVIYCGPYYSQFRGKVERNYDNEQNNKAL